MSFPTVAAVNGGNDSSGNNHTVNLPASISADDLLLVFFCSDSDGETITFPEGWTLLDSWYISSGVTFGVWYKVADGGEGASITVTTGSDEATAHTSYRITGFVGTPEFARDRGSGDDNPDPPNLAPTWGEKETLWFAACGYDNGGETVDGYPANYTDGRNDRYNGSGGCGVGTARRELKAASENPGVYDLSGNTEWVAYIVAVQGAIPPQILLPGGIASGEAFGTPQANFILKPSGIASEEAIGSHNLSYLQYLLPDGIASEETIGAHNLMYLQILLPDAIASEEAIGTAQLNFTLFPTGIASEEGVGEPRLAFRLLMAAIESAEAFGEPRLGLYLSPTGIPTEETVGEPKLNFILAPVGIESEEAFVGTIRVQFVVSPTGIESAEVFGDMVEVIKPIFYIQKYIIEAHNPDGDLVALIRNAYEIEYEREINRSHILTLLIPSDDAQVEYITKANELWLRDVVTGDVVRKFKLQHQLDVRDGGKISSRITAKDFFSQLIDIVQDYKAGTYMNLVDETAAIGSFPIASDDDYFYIADNATNKVKKYLKSDMSLVATQATAYGGDIRGMVVDDTHVYIAGLASPPKIWKLLKSDLSFVLAGDNFDGYMYCLAQDATHVYAGGTVGDDEEWCAERFQKSDLTNVGITDNYGGDIYAIAADATHYYFGGEGTEKIWKCVKATGARVAESESVGVPYAIVTSGDFVYVGGSTGSVSKLNKSDLSQAASGSYGGGIRALTQNDDYVFAGGLDEETIKRFRKDTMELNDTSPVYGAIYGLTLDDTHIYAIGTGVTAVKKYSLFDTVEDIVEELLSYQVNVPPITLGAIAPAYADLVCDIQANDESIADVLSNLRDIVGGYIEVDNDKQLQWYEDIGEDKGQQIRYKKNLLGIEREIYWMALANRIYAYGRSIEGVKVSLSEIQAEDYVEDVPSQTAWGGIFPQRFVAFDITQPETLLTYAQQRLAELKDPPVSYNISSVDLATQKGFEFEKLQLGSVVSVIDEGLNINISARVVKIRHPDLENPLKMEVEIATVVRDITKTIGDIEKVQNQQQTLLLG